MHMYFKIYKPSGTMFCGVGEQQPIGNKSQSFSIHIYNAFRKLLYQESEIYYGNTC